MFVHACNCCPTVSACAASYLTLFPIEVAIVVANVGSLPIAAASSFSVSSAVGADASIEFIAGPTG